MAIGDKVKAALHYSFVGDSPLAIYDVAKDDAGIPVLDSDGTCTPKRIGGVKPGSLGVVVGTGIKAIKSKLWGFDKVPSLMAEYTLLFPVRWEYYQQVAWIPVDHMQVV